MNSKNKYAATRKHRQPGWPRDKEAARLKGFLGAQGCGTSQLGTFDELHQLAKMVFSVLGHRDHKITAAQIEALGTKKRAWLASSYVKDIEPCALWPKVCRARRTLSGLDSKFHATGKLSKRQGNAPSAHEHAMPLTWAPALRHLRDWMISKGVDAANQYSEEQIMTLCWDIYQSGRSDVCSAAERPDNLAALQRRLTGRGRKYRIRDRSTLPTFDPKLGTFGPASAVRHIQLS